MFCRRQEVLNSRIQYQLQLNRSGQRRMEENRLHLPLWYGIRLQKMYFCLKNTPTTFQIVMNNVLLSVKWQSALVYWDYIVLFSKPPLE